MKGVEELAEWKKTKKLLTRKQAIRAFCADCMGEFKDGIKDCNNMNCPLYPYQPYSKYIDPSTKAV